LTDIDWFALLWGITMLIFISEMHLISATLRKIEANTAKERNDIHATNT